MFVMTRNYTLMKHKIYNFLFTFVLSVSLYAQSGPGGYEDTSGSSNLVLWLRADAGVLNGSSNPAANGEAVNTWQDQSGYNYHALLGNGTPDYDVVNAEFNGLPSINFNDAFDEFLFIEDDADEAPQLDNTTGLSIFIALRSDNTGGVHGILCKRDGFNSQESYSIFQNGNLNTRISGTTDAGAALSTTNTQIFSSTFLSGDFEHWLNQTSGGASTGATSPIPNNNSDLNIGVFPVGGCKSIRWRYSRNSHFSTIINQRRTNRCRDLFRIEVWNYAN